MRRALQVGLAAVGLSVASSASAQSCLRWTLRTSGVPGERANHAMAFDAARNVTITHGGGSSVGNVNATHGWDGFEWVMLDPGGPGSFEWRVDHAMAFDSDREVVVTYSGWHSDCANCGFFSYQTWEWDGQTWTMHTRLGDFVPEPRIGHAMAYDERRKATVLFGGNTDSGLFDNHVWEWDGSAWLDRAVPGPPGRRGHAMVYDSQRSVMVMFGGRNNSGMLSDTWEFDGQTWKQVAVGDPGPRAFHAMVYSANTRSTILFGGWDGESYLSDTWEWDGSFWKLLDKSVGPDARRIHAMAYDSLRGVTVLFGGSDGTNIRSETWELAPLCDVDCDNSTGCGVLDIFDFLCFQNAFVNADPYACDCDTTTGPGVCDIFDFLCFQNAFVAGCP
jgi:Galactose oxidase, central domain